MSCVFCGAPGVVPVVFPETFTAYQMLQAGDKACERCHTMFTNGQYRRNCWFMIDTVWAKIEDPLEFLDYKLVALKLEMDADPEKRFDSEPLILYLTKAKRKHGWINAVQNPVLNVNRFILCVDEDRIFFDRAKFNEHLRFLKTLWALELPKCIMLCGYPPAGIIRKYKLTREECQRLQQVQSDRLWRFVVSFKQRKDEDEKV